MKSVHSNRRVWLVATSLLGAGCASIPETERSREDPWEPMNRSIYAFNDTVDRVTLKPLAKGYRAVAPGPVRKGIANFFHNLMTPASSLNNFLQGKPANGFSELGRFAVNSTIGIGGVLDVATASGIEEFEEDFGQTAAVWGVPDGPYVMLPFLGPSTLRDALTTPLDIVANPLYHHEDSSVRDPLYGLRAIDLRYGVLGLEKLLDDSKDKYVTLRESYLQNREFEVYDGDPPVDDDFYDDILEEEDY